MKFFLSLGHYLEYKNKALAMAIPQKLQVPKLMQHVRVFTYRIYTLPSTDKTKTKVLLLIDYFCKICIRLVVIGLNFFLDRSLAIEKI